MRLQLKINISFFKMAPNVGNNTQGRIASAGRRTGRKDAHQKPLLPSLRVVEVKCWHLFII
jgi:hypothetical protein